MPRFAPGHVISFAHLDGAELAPYATAPPLPLNFVDRPEEVAALRSALVTDDGGGYVALTAWKGMGGIGKTVLALALCHDEVVQQAFPDGVVWIPVSKESNSDILTRMREVGRALGDDLAHYENLVGATRQYHSTIRRKAALIVVDDVWRASDLEPWLTESSPRSRVLFTTRNTKIAAAVGAREYVVNLLNEAQSREILARWSGIDVPELPSTADDLIRECGRVPLALSTVGAMVRGKPFLLWRRAVELIRDADVEKMKLQLPDYAHTDTLRAIQVSIDALDAITRERYIALAVLPEDMAVAPEIQQCLWGVNESESISTAEYFLNLSLAQRGATERSVRLHDLQLGYVRAQYPDKEALELIRTAVLLSFNVIATDPSQFASQLIGRLLPYRNIPSIELFSNKLVEGARKPWLRPLQPALQPPGTELVRTLEGHSTWINGVALTPDGKRAVSASHDKTLKLWDLDSGEALRTLEGHSKSVRTVAVTPDCKRAVSASHDKTLKVWNLESGQMLGTMKGHSSLINALALTPDGKRAVSASCDKTLKVWSLESTQLLRTLEGHSSLVNAVAMMPDGKRAVSASDDKTIRVWDLESGQALRTMEGHSDSINGVAVTPDGKRVVSASSDKTLKVWNLQSSQVLHTLEGHSDWVNAVAVTPDGKRAVSASNDRTLKMWDLDSGQLLRTIEGHSSWVYGVAVAPDGKRAISACSDGTLNIWNLESGEALRAIETQSRSITAVAVTADGKRAVSASDDKTLKVSDVKSGQALRTLEGHSDWVNGVAVTPDGRRAVSASDDKTLKVWDLRSGQALRTLEGHSDWVNGVAVTPDGKRAVSASDDKTLKVWDLESGQVLRTMEGHSGWVYGVAVTPDGRRAVSASDDKTLKVWDLKSGQVLRTLEGHSDRVNAVATTPDGRRALSASDDNTLKLWDLESGRALCTLEGHFDWVNGVAVTPDGKRVVSASNDSTLQVWDLESGASVAIFHCDAAATCCTFADTEKIVAGDAGGRLHYVVLAEQAQKSAKRTGIL
jgi:WD40 repeat protein